jgi:hypothetical protein
MSILVYVYTAIDIQNSEFPYFNSCCLQSWMDGIVSPLWNIYIYMFEIETIDANMSLSC